MSLQQFSTTLDKSESAVNSLAYQEEYDILDYSELSSDKAILSRALIDFN